MTDTGHIREEELELFALGALPENEAAVVRSHVAGCDACARTLAEARGRVALLAFGVMEEKPSATAKESLMARVAGDRGARGSERAVVRGERSGERKPTGGWWNWVFVPAALALAAVCLLLSWQNRRLGAELAKSREASAELKKGWLHAEDLVRVLSAADTITVKLAGTESAKQATGVVKYNPRVGTVIYSAENLSAPPRDKVYEMWLVPADGGAAIRAGEFVTGGNEHVWTAQVPPLTSAKAFAVSVEPVGGVDKATGPIVLLGAS